MPEWQMYSYSSALTELVDIVLFSLDRPKMNSAYGRQIVIC